MRAAVVVLGIAMACPASAATVRVVVFDDANGDGLLSPRERGVAEAVVAFDVRRFATTNAAGEATLELPDDASGIAWVRVPDGFVPGPVWAYVDARRDTTIELGLRRRPTTAGPLTFVVASDTHIPYTQEHLTAGDLAAIATSATALDPAPAFFTILGDITQGNRPAEFALVDSALRGLDVPYIPVPGNHDWYDGGAAWFAHYGPDNYSFDIDGVHFVVWNMAMSEPEIRRYLGAELGHVARGMAVVALTHAPPSVPVLATLRELGVDYVLTGHAHSNRVVDHGGLIELNTEPLLMGGLDFTPAGYRVVTIENSRVRSYHRTVVSTPQLSVVWPGGGACLPPTAQSLLVTVELDANMPDVRARLDCGEEQPLRADGGWLWSLPLPPLAPGAHSVQLVASSRAGRSLQTTLAFEVCTPTPPPPAGDDWPQLGGGPTHHNARTHAVKPPLVTRWVASTGGHVVTAPPVITHGLAIVAVSDLADGAASAVVAFDLLTGAQRWRTVMPRQLRGGIAVTADTVIAPLLEGTVIALDVATGTTRWERLLARGVEPEAAALFAPPVVAGPQVFTGHQRAVAMLDARSGEPAWTVDPVPNGRNSQTAAAPAIDGDLAVGIFERAFGGVIAWDARTGLERWRVLDEATVAINASPVIDGDTIYVVNGATEVRALDRNGRDTWRVQLHAEGFDWGFASLGTPALARGVLLVPTLYRDLVALDAATGRELWRFAAEPGPLRTTHYRGAHTPGFAASPVVTGDTVWAVDTSGRLSALDLLTGTPAWHVDLDVPVLAGLAVSGDWIVAASYAGTVHALVPATSAPRALRAVPACRTTSPVRRGLYAGLAAFALAIAAWGGIRLLRRRRVTGSG